ncbi:EndoU domain-containing protein [Acinetobacter sp. 256-1]|nr:EndoU domain-containing protein [Acinetobacter sp. 256-1]
MLTDFKNLPKNVRDALILIKDDPKAFGAAMLQALKDMPAEYRDKAEKVLAAKYNATTPAQFEAAGKAELELRVEIGSYMLGGAGAIKTGAKIVDKTLDASKVLKEKYIIYKTQQGLQIKMRPTHLSEVDGFSQKKGVSGGHNSVEFYDAVKQYDIKIESVTSTGVKGITKIEYRIPAKHPQTGEVTHYKGDGKDPFTKTVYDPKIYTDAKMLDLGKQAAAKGYKDAMSSKNGQVTSVVNGVSFRVYVDKATGEVKSYHPN